MKRPVYYYIL